MTGEIHTKKHMPRYLPFTFPLLRDVPEGCEYKRKGNVKRDLQRTGK